MQPSSPQFDSSAGKPNPAASGTAGSFRMFGIPIRLHFTFLLLIVFILATGLGGGQSSMVNAAYIVALFASVLLHEIGHVMVSRRFGIKTKEIVMYPIGGVSVMEQNPPPAAELWISLTGPMVNFAIAAVLWLALHFTGHAIKMDAFTNTSNANIWERIMLGNLILGLFNLIPAFPMDGGRALRAFLARSRSLQDATRIASAAGRFLAISMLFTGLLSGQYFLMFIAIFVYLGAEQENATVIGRALTQGIPVRAAMITEFHTLSHGNSIRDAANLLLSTSQQDFPVVLGEQVIGLLGRNALLHGMANQGPEAYVAGVMDRNFTKIAPDMDLAEAMPLVLQAGSCALVMEEERLLGLLTKENLTEFLLLRRSGMEPATSRG
ncbi:MAG: site-2 protease family protein [Bryobacteraceae bacterium]